MLNSVIKNKNGNKIECHFSFLYRLVNELTVHLVISGYRAHKQHIVIVRGQDVKLAALISYYLFLSQNNQLFRCKGYDKPNPILLRLLQPLIVDSDAHFMKSSSFTSSLAADNVRTHLLHFFIRFYFFVSPTHWYSVEIR